MQIQPFVVVSGLPASGKTTIAAALAQYLGLCHFDKDTFLEALFEISELSSAEMRSSFSRQADFQFQRAASLEKAAVLSSWWRHPLSHLESGTPIDWLWTSERTIVEVHCNCSLDVAANRFLIRQRHPGHLDERWSKQSLLPMFEQQSLFSPLFPLQAIIVNSEGHIDVQKLAQAVLAKASEIQMPNPPPAITTI